MKSLLTLVLLSMGTVALAQTSRQSTTSTTINDDGKILSVQVDGQVDSRSVEYRRTFDVARLSNRAKDDLKHRIFDSLGIGQPTQPLSPPAPPAPPAPPRGGVYYTESAESVRNDSETVEESNVTLQCASCTGKIKLAITRSTDDYSVERDAKADSQKRFFPYELPLPPGEYRLKYYQNDVLQIQSTFTVTPGKESTVVIK
ncbi:hypothetical protein [Spirosoma utsteinense]|uniref:Uncharacterized protein n=1 Tax=Spirosoma utsteinense TaxID=2585773 RepID=A0ABR6W701_9BACT|nr:hypothetical protein [Spirosoma utsteinense]MBC3786176.1 hypothetical protein [Spirosoma utsteinense]MBC3792366.1 hypothetical protein [Spirosoma utsteinense]